MGTNIRISNFQSFQILWLESPEIGERLLEYVMAIRFLRVHGRLNQILQATPKPVASGQIKHRLLALTS